MSDEEWNAAAEQRNGSWKMASDQYWQQAIENINKTKLKEPEKKQLRDLCNLMKQRYPWYYDFFNTGSGTGKIHYRISVEVGGTQVVLAQTEAPKKAGGKGKKKK